MKTRDWIFLFASLAAVCLLASYLLFSGHLNSTKTEVLSDGVKVMTLDLSVEGEYPIVSDYGKNTLLVAEGKVSVISADCPSQDCVHHAPASSGAPTRAQTSPLARPPRRRTRR